MKRIYITLIFFLFIGSIGFAQIHPIHQDVTQAKLQHTLTEVLEFDAKTIVKPGILEKSNNDEVQFTFDQAIANRIILNQHDFLKLSFPNLKGQDMELELIKADIFADGFKVSSRQGAISNTISFNQKEAVFYRGIVKGDKNSLVSISLFEGSMSGFIYSSTANIGIEQNNDGKHIIRNLDSVSNNSLSCATENDGLGYAPEMLKAPNKTPKSAGDYVSVFIEVEFDIVEWQGGTSQALNYIQDIFNQTASIYANDGIDIRISEIEINTELEYGRRRGRRWTKPNGSSAYLSQFQSAKASTFNGDIAHLVAYNNVGGVAAGFSGICNPNRSQSMCISGFVNDYWFNVQLFAHEMGHLLGSRHTHACVWNGNNTAIDGCSGGVEGGCALPPPAAQNEGTIMSYCYNNYGLDFSEGFHPQPAAVIQNVILAATCLMSDGGNNGPTCSDGIQNGDETGVDCGGSSCAPCASCSDGVQNGDETGIDCGGSCANTCPPASCDAPTNLLVRNMKKRKGSFNAVLDWDDMADASGYDIRVRASGSSNWSTFTSSNSNITVEGFSNGTDYEWEVRTNCSTGDSSYSSCTFTYVSRGSNVTCGAGSSAYQPNRVGIEEVKMSPNPVSSFLLIEILNPQSEDYKLQISNAVGQRIYSAQMTNVKSWIEVDVQGFDTGLYFMTIFNGENKTTQKIFVQ